MNKSLFEQNGGTYRLENGYRIPNLILPDEPEYSIGIWGQQRLNYLKKHKKGLYSVLLISGKLGEHIHEIDISACERRNTIIEQLMKAQEVTEQLKSENAMLWVGKVNNIYVCADEIIRDELIYD